MSTIDFYNHVINPNFTFIKADTLLRIDKNFFGNNLSYFKFVEDNYYIKSFYISNHLVKYNNGILKFANLDDYCNYNSRYMKYYQEGFNDLTNTIFNKYGKKLFIPTISELIFAVNLNKLIDSFNMGFKERTYNHNWNKKISNKLFYSFYWNRLKDKFFLTDNLSDMKFDYFRLVYYPD